ncbi:MAG: hypothetical protein LBQ46_10350 [Treponema sp.]|nr:hypothetical protein [Treponema sp.]
MTAFITRKKSALIFFCAFLAAGGSAALLNYLLEGPKLGPHYDLLLEFRQESAPAPELLIVDSGDLMEGDTAAEMILTLIEMDAAALVIQTPILGFSAEKASSEEEIRSWFEEEFSLLERNIRNLFEAIRVGSIAPTEARRYVDELVGLTGRGKERLTAALVRQGGAGIARLEQAAAAFGQVYRAGDLRLSPDHAVPSGDLTYSRPRRDWDGRIRRISPVGPPEHVVYAALKGRFEESLMAPMGDSLFLVNTREGLETHIPLDSQGSLLFEAPAGGRGEYPDRGFRRISLDLFTRYEETGQTLQRLLREAARAGIYEGLEPEKAPVNLFEYALVQRGEFLVSVDPGNPAARRFSDEWKARWLQTRAEYFAVLEESLYGPAERKLRAGYEELLRSERLDEEGIDRVGALRDELAVIFDRLREVYGEYRGLRETLSQALSSSFVILGPADPETMTGAAAPGLFGLFGGPEYSDSELSFILADNILRSRGIRPLERHLVLFWSLLTIALELLILVRLRPLFSLGLGFVLSLALGAGFSWSFVVWGRWLDPLIPLSASLAGTLSVFALELLLVSQGARRFRRAYGPYVGKSCLRQLIKAGRPAPAERSSVSAAVVAVRQAGLLAKEDQRAEHSPAGDLSAGARALLAFREEASTLVKKAGGVIVGCDGDLMLACFGSPLERIGMGPGGDPYVRYARSPALRAAEFATDLAGQKTGWQFGIDAGECSFWYRPVSGYNAYGRPVVRARILSSLASRYKAKVLISESVRSQIKDIPVRRLTVLKEQDGSGGEAFYQLAFPIAPADS